MKLKSDFWRDVLLAWSEYNQQTERRIENQMIWYNSRIRIKNTPVMWNDVYQRGLKYVHQLYEGRKFKSDEQVMEQYGLNKLRYNGLKLAIPKEWKDFFQSNPKISYLPLPPHNYDLINTVYIKGLSHKIYKFLQDDCMLIHNKYVKWRSELGVQYEQSIVEYAKEHANLYRVTNIPKYRSFQYRLLQRALITNVQLYKWKIVESPLCSFCGEYDETTIHMLWECKEVYPLWQRVVQFIKDNYGLDVNIDLQKIIFNRIHPKIGSIANLICVITKQYIYKQRCCRNTINLSTLKSVIFNVENIEKYIACKNNRENIHYRKWRFVHDVVPTSSQL